MKEAMVGGSSESETQQKEKELLRLNLQRDGHRAELNKIPECAKKYHQI